MAGAHERFLCKESVHSQSHQGRQRGTSGSKPMTAVTVLAWLSWAERSPPEGLLASSGSFPGRKVVEPLPMGCSGHCLAGGRMAEDQTVADLNV